MAKFGVSPRKEAELLAQMDRCGVHEGDLEEKFIRSGGPGGQHVNRSATCVYIKHVTTGIEVKMQKARSQALNRFYARRRLCELIEEGDGSQKSKEMLKRDKLRKQKARRRRKSQKKYESNVESSDSP